MEELVEGPVRGEVGALHDVKDRAHGVTDAPRRQQQQAGHAHGGEVLPDKEQRPAHGQVEHRGEGPGGVDPEELAQDPGDGHAPEDKAEAGPFRLGHQHHGEGGVAPGDEDVDHAVVQLPQSALDAAAQDRAGAVVIDGAGGVEGHQGEGKDHGGGQGGHIGARPQRPEQQHHAAEEGGHRPPGMGGAADGVLGLAEELTHGKGSFLDLKSCNMVLNTIYHSIVHFAIAFTNF